LKNKKGLMLIIPLLVFFVTQNLVANQEEMNELTNISYKKTNDRLEVQIQYRGEVTYEKFFIPNPDRLVLDLDKISKISATPVIEINEAGISKITANTYKADSARIVLYFLEKGIGHEIEKTNSGLKVIFGEVRTESISSPKTIGLKNTAIGLSSGYFALRDSLFREIYGDGGSFFRGELSIMLPVTINYVDLWTSFSSFKRTGKSTFYEEDLEVKFTSFSLALRYLGQISRFLPFAGIGIDYISYKEMFHEGYVISSVGGSDVGYHLQAGAYIFLHPSLSTKFHVKYNIANTEENNLLVNLGGIEYGFSLVFHFDL